MRYPIEKHMTPASLQWPHKPASSHTHTRSFTSNLASTSETRLAFKNNSPAVGNRCAPLRPCHAASVRSPSTGISRHSARAHDRSKEKAPKEICKTTNYSFEPHSQQVYIYSCNARTMSFRALRPLLHYNTQIKRSQENSSEGTRKILREVFNRLCYLG